MILVRYCKGAHARAACVDSGAVAPASHDCFVYADIGTSPRHNAQFLSEEEKAAFLPTEQELHAIKRIQEITNPEPTGLELHDWVLGAVGLIALLVIWMTA